MDNFIKQYSCPVCNQNNSAVTVDYPIKSNKYLDQIIIKYSISVEKLQNLIELSKCNRCSIYFFNKWFTKSIAIDLFASLRHKQGWKNYIETTERGTEFYNNNQKVINFINKEKINIDTYIEYGCPFMGLMPLVNDINNSKKFLLSSLIIKAKKSSLKIEKDILNFSFLNNFLSKFFSLYLKFFKNRKSNNYFNFEPKKIYFVDNKSFLTWTYGCNLAGISCRSLITEQINFNKFNYVEFDDLDTKVNFGYFPNVLDHSENPNLVLEKINDNVEKFLIKTHLFHHGGAQHMYFFTPEYFTNYANKNNRKIFYYDQNFLEIKNFDNLLNDIFIYIY